MKLKRAENVTARVDIAMKQIVTKILFVKTISPLFSPSDCTYSALSLATKSKIVERSLNELTMDKIMRSFLKNPARKNLQIIG